MLASPGLTAGTGENIVGFETVLLISSELTF